MNYPLRGTVKHTRRRKDDIKVEGDVGLLFRIAALGFVSMIPAKQKSRAVQISFNSVRCHWEPNELHYQRRAAADAGQRRKGLQDLSGLPFSLSPSPFCKPWGALGRKSLQVTQRKSLKRCQEPLQAALSSGLSSALFAAVGPYLGCPTCHSSVFPSPVLWSRSLTSQPIFPDSSSLACPIAGPPQPAPVAISAYPASLLPSGPPPFPISHFHLCFS